MESPSNTRKSFTYRDWATTQRQDRFLLIQFRRQRFLNATRLNNELKKGTGQLVGDRLHKFELGARRPAVRVPLTRQYVHDRLNFARTSVRRTIREWTSVRLIDDSRFCLDFTVQRQLVLKMSKEDLMNVKK